MHLISVYKVPHGKAILFALLQERTPEQSISHKQMPGWQDHCRFVGNMPYREWDLMEVDGTYVGAIYLTKQREVGISVFKKYHRKGYASEALKLMRKRHQGKLYANINPANEESMEFFHGHGFKLIQVTFLNDPKSTD